MIAKLDLAEGLLGQAETDRDDAQAEAARLAAARDRLQNDVATLRDAEADAEGLRAELAVALAAGTAAEDRLRDAEERRSPRRRSARSRC